MTDAFKARIRVPTADQYAFLEIDAEGSPEAIYAAYERFSTLVKVGEGMEPKEWNSVLDRYATGGKLSVGEHERMNAAQRWMIHELDKCFKRVNGSRGARTAPNTLEDNEE